MKIHQKISETPDQASKINLQGIAVGDGWIDARLQMKVYIDYAYNMVYLDTAQRSFVLKKTTPALLLLWIRKGGKMRMLFPMILLTKFLLLVAV